MKNEELSEQINNLEQSNLNLEKENNELEEKL